MEVILNGGNGQNVPQLAVVVCAGIPGHAPIPHRKTEEKLAKSRIWDLPGSRRSATLRNAVSFLAAFLNLV